MDKSVTIECTGCSTNLLSDLNTLKKTLIETERELIGLKETAPEFRYRNLNEEQINFLSNGCGPQGKWYSEYIPQFCFKSACDQHDVNYWIGFTEDHRLKADKQFYAHMKRNIAKKAWYRKPILHTAAFAYYRCVRRGGKGSFHYGAKERGWKDLIDAMHNAKLLASF